YSSSSSSSSGYERANVCPGTIRASTQKSLRRPPPRSMTTPATTGPKSSMAATVSGSVSIAAAAASHHSREGNFTSLPAEDLADRREQSARLIPCGVVLALGREPAPLGVFLPRRLQRRRRVARRQHQLARLAVRRLDGDVQQALLVEEEVHPLAGDLRGEAQRAEVLVVDDLVAVALEDVQLQALPVARRGKTEA